jgi:hypothetical protein
LVKKKSADIDRRWFMSCKTLLAAALAGAIALEELSIERIPGNSRMPLSALEVIASNWPQWATSLVKLDSNLSTTFKKVCLDTPRPIKANSF